MKLCTLRLKGYLEWIDPGDAMLIGLKRQWKQDSILLC